MSLPKIIATNTLYDDNYWEACEYSDRIKAGDAIDKREPG